MMGGKCPRTDNRTNMSSTFREELVVDLDGALLAWCCVGAIAIVVAVAASASIRRKVAAVADVEVLIPTATAADREREPQMFDRP